MFRVCPPGPLRDVTLNDQVPTLHRSCGLKHLYNHCFLTAINGLLARGTPLAHRLIPIIAPRSVIVPPTPITGSALITRIDSTPRTGSPAFGGRSLT